MSALDRLGEALDPAHWKTGVSRDDSLCVEVDPSRIERRVESGYLMKSTPSLDQALEWIDQTHPDLAGKPVAWMDRLLWYDRWKLNGLRREAEELLNVTSENVENE